MTLFHGMLLFDFPEPKVGKWHECLGYRGMMDVWHLSGTPWRVIIEPWDDTCDLCASKGKSRDECACEEVWIANDETGSIVDNYIAESYEEAKKWAKEWMHEHQDLSGHVDNLPDYMSCACKCRWCPEEK